MTGFFCKLLLGRLDCFASVYGGYTALVWTHHCGLLYDRFVLFISKDYSSIVVLYYYKLSLMSFTCWSSLAYSLTSSGNRLIAISTDSDLLNPNSLDSHVRLSLKVSSVRMEKVPFLFLGFIFIGDSFHGVITPSIDHVITSSFHGVMTSSCNYAINVMTFCGNVIHRFYLSLHTI